MSDRDQHLSMTRTERVMAAVNGDEVDRVPVCFWHHFSPGGSGRRMADATRSFFVDEFDLDIAKIMPDIPYPFPRNSLSDIEDWLLIEPIDLSKSRYINQRAESVRILREQLGDETPIIMTAFSPLAEALYFSKDRELFFEQVSSHPAIIHEALRTIAANLSVQMEMMILAGADGMFFALQGCSTTIMSDELYREIGRPYDLMALEGAQDGWLNILHIHGDSELMFDSVIDYPVSVLSWSDRLAGPGLAEARSRTSKCLMGGWHEFGALSNGPVDKIKSEAEDAISQTGGKGFILANGCSVPDETDHAWLHEARGLVDELPRG